MNRIRIDKFLNSMQDIALLYPKQINEIVTNYLNDINLQGFRKFGITNLTEEMLNNPELFSKASNPKTRSEDILYLIKLTER